MAFRSFHCLKRQSDLIGARGALGARPAALNALEPRDDFIHLHSLHEGRDALKVAMASANDVDAQNDIAIVMDDELARANVLRDVGESLFHIIDMRLLAAFAFAAFAAEADDLAIDFAGSAGGKSAGDQKGQEQTCREDLSFHKGPPLNCPAYMEQTVVKL